MIKTSKSSSKSRFHTVSFLAILTFLFVLGGGSRTDIASLPLITTVIALTLPYAFIAYKRAPHHETRIPILLLAALAIWIVIQLVPLPASVWQQLPGRDVIVTAYVAADLDLGWKPISVVPLSTVNSLGAIILPLVILMLFTAAKERGRVLSAYVFVGFALISAVIGLAQVIGGELDWLYFYRLTNEGAPVGLFANRNHQGTLLAAAIPMIMAVATSLKTPKFAGPIHLGALLICFALVVVVVMTGSRSATVLAFLTFSLTLVIFRPSHLKLRYFKTQLSPALLGLLVFVGLLSVLFVIFTVTDGAAFQRFAEKDSLDDLRFKILPQIFVMAKDGFPFGWGFGTFPEVYEIYEPTEFILPYYLNHAHNDLLEFVIEGGLPSLLIMVGLVAWVANRTWAVRMQMVDPQRATHRIQVAAAIGLAVFAAASFSDYPLRTPALAGLAALLLGLLAKDPDRHSPSK